MATATPTVDLGVAFGIPGLAGKQFPAKGLTDPGVPAIISNYVFRLPLLRKALTWMDGQAGRSIYLAGPAGSGKTSLAEQVAGRRCGSSSGRHGRMPQSSKTKVPTSTTTPSVHM